MTDDVFTPGGGVEDTPDGLDDVQADPHDDPDAEVLDGDTGNELVDPPAEFAAAGPGETREDEL
jgi:hypothetical protein